MLTFISFIFSYDAKLKHIAMARLKSSKSSVA